MTSVEVAVRSVEEHLASCLELVAPLAARATSLTEAVGLVLADDVTSTVDLPSFDNSSMDGYAVALADVAGASPQNPVVLPVSADLPAGVRTSSRLSPGTAARIMTGAPVPEGAEGVVQVELTDGGTERVRLHGEPPPGRHIRRVGEDVRAGDLLLRRGTRVVPRHVATLAATGHDRVPVHPRPRVVVLSTGSELVEPGADIGFGQVYDANGPTLAAAAAAAGALVVRPPLVPDDPDLLTAALEEHAPTADLVLTSGGVSAGAYDTVKEVLSRLGSVHFGPVAMQPGRPQGAGTLGAARTPVLTLPGNPVSAYVSFEVFVRPVLRRLLGHRELQRPTVVAAACGTWSSSAGRRQYVRARLSREDPSRDRFGRHHPGGCRVTPVGGHGSHLTADLAGADVLAVVPQDCTRVADGDPLTCLLLDRDAP